jgi:hypothetical protein
VLLALRQIDLKAERVAIYLKFERAHHAPCVVAPIVPIFLITRLCATLVQADSPIGRSRNIAYYYWLIDPQSEILSSHGCWPVQSEPWWTARAVLQDSDASCTTLTWRVQ